MVQKNTPTGLFRVIHTLDNVYERDTVNCNIMHQLFIIFGEILGDRYDVNKIM